MEFWLNQSGHLLLLRFAKKNGKERIQTKHSQLTVIPYGGRMGLKRDANRIARN